MEYLMVSGQFVDQTHGRFFLASGTGFLSSICSRSRVAVRAAAVEHHIALSFILLGAHFGCSMVDRIDRFQQLLLRQRSLLR